MCLSRGIVLAVALVVAVAQFAKAQVLDQIPTDALIVVKVRNLAETNTKLTNFFKELGVDQMVPELADPLGSLKKQLNIQQGLDEKGEIAFVFIDPAASGAEGPDQSLLLLIPVSDYKAFTGNFADAKTEGDLTEVQFPQDPDPSFIASWGKFAAISPSKALLGKKPEGGVKLAGLTAKELANKDAIFYANLVAIRKTALPSLKSAREDAIAEATRSLTGANEKYVPVAKAVVGQALNVVERFLEDAHSASYGISFGANGINGTLMTEFEQGTYLGDNVKKITNSNDAMLTGLPNTKYLVYGGFVSSPEATVKVVDDTLAPIIKEVTALGEEGKPLLAYVDSLKKMWNATRGAQYGMVAPSGMLGQDSIIQVVQAINGDSKAIGEAQKSMLEHQQELMTILDPNGVQAKTAVTPNSKTIDGVTLDEYKTDFSGQPNNPQAAHMQQMMQMIYGASGLNVFSGALDNKTRVIGMGVSEEVLQQLITATKTKDDSLAKSEGVALVSSELPKQRIMVAYVAVDNVITTGLKYAGAMGMNVPLNIPPNQPPFGVTVATEGTAIRVDTFLPTQLVKSVTAAVIQLQVQMQGGGGGGM